MAEEQRKERLRIIPEKDARRRTKSFKRKRKVHQKQKTTRNSAWPLSKYIRLEKVVASKQLRLFVEMNEERRAKLENTKRLRLAMENDEERKANLEKMVATTLLMLALDTEKERRATKKRNVLALLVMETI